MFIWRSLLQGDRWLGCVVRDFSRGLVERVGELVEATFSDGRVIDGIFGYVVGAIYFVLIRSEGYLVVLVGE